MTRSDVAIDWLRKQKARLTTKRGRLRLLVPLVEVAEFWLSHGFREVLVRARLRLNQPLPPPPGAPFYRFPVDDGSPLAALTIPPPADQIRASIVVPVVDHPFLTYHCLASIIDKTDAGTYEVIVIDNGSGQPMRQMLSSVTGVRVIRNETNAGFVGACNQGAAAARGEFLVFLNNDTVVLPGWLARLIQTAEGDESVGAVAAKLIYPDGRLQEAGGIIWSDGHGWNHGRLSDPESPEFCYIREVDYGSAACLLVRRSLFDALEGFDSRFAPAYYEDVDLCFRMRERGFRVLYQPEAKVIHVEGATAGTDTSSGFKKYQSINHGIFVDRHASALAAQQAHDPRRVHRARDRRAGKRILVVDHMVPQHDQDAGSLRMQTLLRMLVELGHAVTFVPDNLARLEPYTAELQQLGVEVIYGPRSVVEFLEAHDGLFDVAIVCRAYFASKYLPVLQASSRPPFIIFDTVDLHFLREQRFAELEDDAALARSAKRTRAVELAVMRASDAVWVTSTHEADLLNREAAARRVEVVPAIHDVRTDVPPFGRRRDILFIGSFLHPPNEGAVVYFVHEILPLVRRAVPGVQFLVVGAHAPRSIRKLASADVIVLGHVPDVRPVFDRCRLSVAPLLYGAGVKGKVTQSLAWGLPVVATPVAAEGLQMVDGEHLLVASDPAEFARCVIELHENEALWTRLVQNGRDHIERHFGYAAVRESVRAMLERAAPAADARAPVIDSEPI